VGLESLRIVALRRVSYSDRHAILTAWSRERGRVSLLVPDGAGRGAARYRALTIPPSLLEAEADVRPGREIWPVRTMRPLAALGDLRANPLKSLVGQVVADILAGTLLRSGPDPLLFDFIELSLAVLDAARQPVEIANFHLAFLRHLLHFMGIEPDLSTYSPGSLLDLRDGIFRRSLPAHPDCLSAGESAAAARLGRMTMANMRAFSFTRAERNRAVDLMLRYMVLHHAVTAPPKSLEIVRSLF